MPTLAEIRGLLAEALNDPDLYYAVVADKDAFMAAMRSGGYTVVMILRQDIPLDMNAQRELREAVRNGTGLLVAHWKNSVPPVWQEVFGVDFKGSLAMSAEQRPLHLYAGALSEAGAATAVGRVLHTPLAGGTLAAILPAPDSCNGVRGVTLAYPRTLEPGDRMTVSAAIPVGKRLSVVDSESIVPGEGDAGPINRSVGNLSGDLSVVRYAGDGLTLALTAPPGALLGAEYLLTVTVTRRDGMSATTTTVLTPTCAAHLQPGMDLGGMQVAAVDEDRRKLGDDLPAVVTGRFGSGRTVFFAYDPLLSAWSTNESSHLDLLRRAARWLAPADSPRPAGIALLQTDIRVAGAAVAAEAVETLGRGMDVVPLFGTSPAELRYALQLSPDATASYRYFVRFADRSGDFAKSTQLYLDGNLFASAVTTFSLSDDSVALLQGAQLWLSQAASTHPEARIALDALRGALEQLAVMPDRDTLRSLLLQAIWQADNLPFDTTVLHSYLNELLRIGTTHP